MSERANPASIFSQKLDRVAFVAYLLGAVVPLAALAVVVQRFVLNQLDDRVASFGLIGLVLSVAVLSLGAFLTLRRTTRNSLERMDRDNERLSALLEVSGALASVAHARDAGERTTDAALSLSGADAAFALVRGEPGAPPQRLAASGRDAEKLELEHVEPLVEIAKLVMSQGQPAVQGASADCPALAAVALPGEGIPAGALVVMGARKGRFDTGLLDALGSLAGLASVALRNADLRDSQRNFFTHVTDMLVSALDSSLGYHKGHGTRVAALANRLGREMGLEDHRRERLHFAALLHDVGMLKLERHLQMSPKTCAKHTILGARMLGRIRLWQDLAPIVQHHHERWDGAGYPDGLSGADIPLESRIIAVCDVLDTITSQASYKDPVPLPEALHEIESEAGQQFDPDVVSALSALARRGELELPSAA